MIPSAYSKEARQTVSPRRLLTPFYLVTVAMLIMRALSLLQAAEPINESFDAGIPSDWIIINNSNPAGADAWTQGDANKFVSYSGGPSAFAGVNYTTGSGASNLSTWMLTPITTIKDGDTFSFYTRTVTNVNYPDRLEVRLSLAGVSQDVGTTDASVGDFTTLLLTINPDLTTSDYPTVWTKYTVTISGVPTPTVGRYAFRYAVANGGPGGSNSDYIGIDDVVSVPYVPPTPVVSSPTSALIAGTQATLGGNVTSDNGSPITERGIVYAATATNGDPVIGGTGVTKVNVNGTTGVFSAAVTGLTVSTGYSYKAFATNANGTSYTSVAAFTTLASQPQEVSMEMPLGTPLASPVVAWGAGAAQSTVPAGLQGARLIAAGSDTTLVVKGDGRITGFPDTGYGLVTPPAFVTDPKALAVGFSFAVALDQNSVLYAWGNPLYTTFGQTTIPSTAIGVTAIAAGWHHALALRYDGAVVAWGKNDVGQTNVPDFGGAKVIAIAAAVNLSAALTDAGNVVTWGGNSFIGSQPAGVSDIVAFDASTNHIIALRSNGTVVCWGFAGNGQCAVPDGLTDVVSVSATSNASFARKRDGTVVAWGLYTQTGIPAGLSGVSLMESGETHTAALRREVEFGIVPLGSSITKTLTVRNLGDAALTVGTVEKLGSNAALAQYTVTQPTASVAGGGSTTFDITFAPGSWGAGKFPITLKLTTNDTDEGTIYISVNGEAVESPPTLAAPTATSITPVAATLNGNITAHGGYYPNSRGFVYSMTSVNADPLIGGSGVIQKANSPVPFGAGSVGAYSSNVFALMPGTTYTLKAYATNTKGTGYSPAITFTTLPPTGDIDVVQSGGVPLDNGVVGWGRNQYGETNPPSTLPSNLVAVTGGLSFAIALSRDGTVVGWGNNSSGQTNVPTGLSDVVSIAAGDNHALALKNDGTVVAWGSNSSQQITLPSSVSAGGITAISASANYSLALKDGGVIAWGSGSVVSAVPVAATSDIVAISAGQIQAMALKSDGTIVAWGSNTYSQTSPLPADLGTVARIASGGAFNTALNTSGKLFVWGYNSNSQTAVPSDLIDIASHAAAGWHTVVRKMDGSLVSWGDNQFNQATVPVDLYGVTDVGTGDRFNVALRRQVNFGTNSVGSSLAKTLVIKNTEDNALTISSISFIGGDAADFSLVQPESTSIAGGSSATFSITFSPSAIGVRSTKLRIVSNDTDEANYDVLITGTGGNSAPTVTTPTFANVQVGTATLGGNITSDGGAAITERGIVWTTSDSGNQQTIGGVGAHKVVGSGTDTGVFTVAVTGLPTVGGNLLFTAYATNAEGTSYSSVQSFASVAAAPGFVLEQPAETIIARDTSQFFGSVMTGASAPLTFTVRNTGNVALSSLALSIDGTNPSEFTFGAPSSTTLAVNGSATVVVTFAPAALSMPGSRAASLHVSALGTAGGTTSYDISLTGTALAFPEVAVFNGASTAAGDELTDNTGTQTFANTNVGGSSAQTFTLKNTGTADLTGLAISNTGDFNITQPAVTTLAPDATTTFTVSFVPTATGTRTGVISIASNDDDENPFEINVSGTGALQVPSLGTTSASPTDITALIIQTGRHDNGSPITEVGVVWSVDETNAAPLIGGEGVTRVAFPTITDSTLELFSLTPSTTYAVRTYAINAGGTGYSDVVTFTTKAGQPFFVMEEGGQVVASTVLAWGSDNAGQVLVPADLRDVEDVAAGHQFSMAKKRGGSLVMWGQGAQGQTTVPTDVVRAKSISAASAPIVTMGNFNYARTWGSTAVPLPSSANYFFSVSAGNAHVLAVTGSHRVRAWGDDTSGQSTVPSLINSGFSASRPQVSAGGDFSSALKDGSVYVWGANATGNLSVPGDLGTVTAIDAGDAHILALMADGTVRAWGSNTQGQTNVPAGLTGVQSVSAGSTMSAAVKGDGSVVTWGGVPSDVPQPSQLKNISKVSAGDSHLLAVQLPELVFASSAIGVAATKTLTLRNAGAVEGSTPGLSLSGPQASAFALNAPSTTVAAGSTQTFTITYTPTTVGNSHATLTMTDFTGTMEVALTGYVVLPPEITVFNGTDELTDNTGTQSFANTNVGSTSSAQTFTIKNTGSTDLTDLVVSKTGDFTITQPALTTLAPDATTTFTVSFVPTATGTRTGVISIASDDADENPFEINVSGTGVVNPPTMYSFQSAVPDAYYAALSGQVMMDNGSPVTEVGVVFALTSVNADPRIGGTGVTKVERFNPTMDEFSVFAVGLTPGTGYSFRAYGTNAGGTGYSSLGTFTTLRPVIFTTPVLTKVNYNTYTLTVEITDDGGSEITERGILWNDTMHPDPYYGDPNANKLTSPGGIGAFTLTASNLTTPSGHSMLAYAVNANGVFYSQHFNFPTASPTAPAVTTPTFANVMNDTATLGGTIENDGGSPITERGVVWITSTPGQELVIGGVGAHQVIASGTDTGIFTVQATGLPNAGGIIFKAYATNAQGTSYSEQGTFLAASGTPVLVVEQPVSTPVSGHVTGWGANWGGQLLIPEDTNGISAISSGDTHSLALRNGEVLAWGANHDGEANVPPGLTDVVAISAGLHTSAAVRSDGTVVTWGQDEPAFTASQNLSNVKSIASSRSSNIRAALMNDGTVKVWGGYFNVPTELPVMTQIAAGTYHVAALTEDGHVHVWGYNYYGENEVPEGLADVTAIAAGDYFTMALKSDGTVVVWGGWSDAPKIVPEGLSDVVEITATNGHCLAMKSSGEIVSWGNNWYGENNVPANLDGVTALSGGGTFVNVLRSGVTFGRDVMDGAVTTRTFTLRNTGNATLSISSASLVGAQTGAEDFTITTQPASTVAAGGTTTLTVSFNASGQGIRQNTLQIASNDPAQPTTLVTLTGDGVPTMEPPLGTDFAVSTYEDVPRVIDYWDFGFYDSDGHTYTGLIITTLPMKGTLWQGGTQITEPGAFVSRFSQNVRYQPAADESGAAYDSFTFQVMDSGIDGMNTDTTPRTVTISVWPASERPEGADKTITMPANGRHLFTADDFDFSDPNDDPPNNFVGVYLHLPYGGQFKLNGEFIHGGDFGPVGFGEGLFFDEGLFLNLSGRPGARWKAQDSPRDWVALATSADGGKVVAVAGEGLSGELLTSTNGGESFTQRFTGENFTGVASSSDGMKLIACSADADENPGQLFLSTDGGETWTPGLAGNWSSVASSTDGLKLVAVELGELFWGEDGPMYSGGAIHCSSDGGLTWSEFETDDEWHSVACSADGLRIAMCNDYAVLLSTDGGLTWTQTGSAGGNALTMSADGMRIAVANGEFIHLSSDGGSAWMSVNDTSMGQYGQWKDIACSADGMVMVVVGNADSISYSYNGGQSWFQGGNGAAYTCCAVAADGSRLFAGANMQSSGQINFSEEAAIMEEEMTQSLFTSDAGSIPELIYYPSNHEEIIEGDSIEFTFQVVDDGSASANKDITPNTLTIEFGPPLPLPTLTDVGTPFINLDGAVLSATLNDEHDAEIFERGFQYALTSENPELFWGYETSQVAVPGDLGTFIATVGELTPDVSYSFRAYAHTSAGDVYSEILTFTPGTPRPLAVGNLVFFDKNGNGHADAGEGLGGVRVELHRADAEPGEDEPVAFTTTDSDGFWLMDNVLPGSYRLFIPSSMFAADAPLWKMRSMNGVLGDGDDDAGEDGEDSLEPHSHGVRTGAFTLAMNTMPSADAETGLNGFTDDGRDADMDLTRDLGFVDLTDLPPDFNDWKQRHGRGGSQPLEDEKKDLLDYALGNGPDDPDTSTHFSVDDDHDADETHVMIRRRHGSQSDVIYRVQFRSSLDDDDTWTDSNVAPVITNNGDGTETVTFPSVNSDDPELQGRALGFTRLVLQLVGSPAVTITSDILGWQHRPLAPRNQTFGIPFVRPAIFTGTADGVSDSTLTFTTPISALVGGEQYYVEVLEGENEGHRLEVDETASNTTQIVLLPANSLSTMNSVPASLMEDRFALRPHWRVKDLFPPADYTATTNPATADQLQLWNPAVSGYISLYLLDHPTNGRLWARAGDLTAASQNDRVIGPADGLFAKPRNAVIAAADGQVRTWKFACPLRSGTNFIGNPYPVAQSLDSRLMRVANGFTGGNTTADSDKVYFWTGDGAPVGVPGYETFYLFDNGATRIWAKSGEITGADHKDDLIFAPGTGVFINSLAGHSTWVMPAAIAP